MIINKLFRKRFPKTNTKMNIKSKIMRTGTALGLVGILAMNEGCATPEGNAVVNAFLGAASTPSATDTDFDKIGKFGAGLGSVYTGAATQRQLQEAGASRVNVNVNTNAQGNNDSQGQSYTQNSEVDYYQRLHNYLINNDEVSWACNSWIDKNSDDIINVKNGEVYGLKNKFRVGEQVMVATCFGNLNGMGIIKIVDPDKYIILSTANIIKPGANIIYRKFDNGFNTPGRYLLESYINGNLILSHNFIVEN